MYLLLVLFFFLRTRTTAVRKTDEDRGRKSFRALGRAYIARVIILILLIPAATTIQSRSRSPIRKLCSTSRAKLAIYYVLYCRFQRHVYTDNNLYLYRDRDTTESWRVSELMTIGFSGRRFHRKSFRCAASYIIM